MKNIYELLNDIDIDESEFAEMDVTELEKAKVKKALKKSIRNKKKSNSWKKNVLVASIVIGLSTTTFGLAFPTYASNIPVIGDIFRFLDNDRTGIYTNYKDYSTEINMSKESKGINVTINDAIFDGKTISLTYSIESEKDLGDNPHILEHLNVKGTNGATGSSQLSRVDENHYVGLITSSLFDHEGDIAKIKWNINTLINHDTGEEIKGNWNFALSLEATDSQDQLIGQSTEQDGVKVSIEKLSVTPMSFIVYYNQEVSEAVRNKWHEVDVVLEIKDDLGNIYLGEGNGGSGKDLYDMSWSATFERLEQSATKLIVTPRVTFRSYNSDNHGGVELTENGAKELPIPEKTGVGTEDIILENMIVKLKK